VNLYTFYLSISKVGTLVFYSLYLQSLERYFVCSRGLIFIYLFIFIALLFIWAYKAWVISPSCPHPLPYHPHHPLPLLPTPSIPIRNYFALSLILLKREYKQ
jgi:hypothetical protein